MYFSPFAVFLEGDDSRHFAVCLMNVFWKLHSCQPVNPSLSPLSSIGKSEDFLWLDSPFLSAVHYVFCGLPGMSLGA